MLCGYDDGMYWVSTIQFLDFAHCPVLKSKVVNFCIFGEYRREKSKNYIVITFYVILICAVLTNPNHQFC